MCINILFPSPSVLFQEMNVLPMRWQAQHRAQEMSQHGWLVHQAAVCLCCAVCWDREELVSGLEIWLETKGNVLETEKIMRKGANIMGKAQAITASGASGRVSVRLWIQRQLKFSLCHASSCKVSINVIFECTHY